MTETEWLECTEPELMLEFLQGKASDRKLRLFACACCRRIWQFLTESRFRDLVQITEDYADGLVTEEVMRSSWYSIVADSATTTVVPDAYHAVGGTVFENREMPPGYGPDTWAIANIKVVTRGVSRLSDNPKVEVATQSTTLRCIIGNPFRPIAINPSWLAWNDGTVPRIAQGIYEDRAFDRMPILADALQDAGCNNADILSHCRSEGLHVKGCWVVDLLLGRE